MTVKYALIIIFIHACFQEGMILAPFRRILDGGLPQWLRKPLYECIICMSGIYVLAFWGLDGFVVGYDTAVTIAMVGGINIILSPFVELTIFELQRKMTASNDSR